MITASQLSTGMTISIGKNIYRVEHAVKVSSPASKANSFVKVKLRDLQSEELIEKNFKPTQEIDDVSLEEHKFEFLYIEGDYYVFLDTSTLELMNVPKDIIGSKSDYLKEGIEVKATCCGTTTFSIDLPQFLELMVSAIESDDDSGRFGQGARVATLETGAQVEVPPFIDVGDIIKVNPESKEYIQRV